MSVVYLKQFLPLYIKAALLTIELSLLAIFFALIIGLLCLLLQLYNISFLAKISKAYIELSRNTPLLIQLFFLYYALPKIGINLSSFSCALIGLSFLGGSYMAECFRAGFEAVKKQQFQAGLSLGFKKSGLYRYIIFPQALAIAAPSLSASIIFLIKESSVVSIVALPDLVYVSKDIIGLYYRSNEALFLLFISYLLIILPLSLALAYLEKRLRHEE